jgi:hypothetical protein
MNRFPDGSLVGVTWHGKSRASKVARCLWELEKHATGDRRATGTAGEWVELLDDALDGDDALEVLDEHVGTTPTEAAR